MTRKQDDDSFFRAAMAAEGVRPVDPGTGRAVMRPAAGTKTGRLRRQAVEAALRGRNGRATPALAEDEEPSKVGGLALDRRGEEVEARADGVDKRTWRKLAEGQIPVAASLDLHGQTSAVAEEKTARFIAACRAAGHQAVAVVHGRGLHSGREGPVLKDRVLALLTESATRAHVLALASAPLRHGGPGVTLVLLRTKR